MLMALIFAFEIRRITFSTVSKGNLQSEVKYNFAISKHHEYFNLNMILNG